MMEGDDAETAERCERVKRLRARSAAAYLTPGAMAGPEGGTLLDELTREMANFMQPGYHCARQVNLPSVGSCQTLRKWPSSCPMVKRCRLGEDRLFTRMEPSPRSCSATSAVGAAIAETARPFKISPRRLLDLLDLGAWTTPWLLHLACSIARIR
jgi:hypothetical protein